MNKLRKAITIKIIEIYIFFKILILKSEVIYYTCIIYTMHKFDILMKVHPLFKIEKNIEKYYNLK